MSNVQNPPTINEAQATKVWVFSQNADGSLSPSSGGGGGGGNVNITEINGAAVAIGNPLPVELSDGTNPLGTTGNPIHSADNVAQWGGTAVSAPPASGIPPVGTEVAPVVKPVQRRFAAVSTTALLGSSATFTSSWIDTQQTGDAFVEISCFSDKASNTNGVMIQESDDTSNSNFTRIVFQGTTTASTFFTAQANIRARYWRVSYQNSGTAQTSFELVANASSVSSMVSLGVLAGNQGSCIPVIGAFAAGANNGQQSAVLVAAVGAGGLGTDGSIATTQIVPQAGGSANLAVVPYLVTQAGSSPNQSAQRTPNVFKTAKATATGTTAVWTPTTGKKFRLMRFKIIVTANSAQTTGAVVDFDLQDSSTSINLIHSVFIPTTAITTNINDGYDSGWIDLGNGYLSTAANNVLNLVFSATGFSGAVRVIACGTEE